MFDIGFWELTLIGVIALLVVGPERLPGMARTVGYWVGRMRRYVSHVRDDIEREIRADELREIMRKSELDEIRDAVGEAGSVFKDTVRDIESADREESRTATAASPLPADSPSPPLADSSHPPEPGAPAPVPGADVGGAIADAGGRVLSGEPAPAHDDAGADERR